MIFNKDSPYVQLKTYLDTYMGFHYLSFIKLYNNESEDVGVIEICKLHLNVLLAFATAKNEKIIRKFYQLRSVDFLVREIMLEFDIEHKREKFFEILPPGDTEPRRRSSASENSTQDNISHTTSDIEHPKGEQSSLPKITEKKKW